MKRLRIGFQVAVLVAAAVTGFRFAMGWSRTSIETFCPFGGLETAWSLITRQRFTCATGEFNVSLFLALLALTFLTRKSFCGWICPVGAISEWFAALGRKVLRRPRKDADGAPLHALKPPRRVDLALRWLRLPVLALILFFTYKTGELVFRGYDPYYILFSVHGHGVRAWSYVIMAVIFFAVVFFPMAWCRYLCPLGVVLWPVSRLGRLRLVRDAASCTGCTACDRACPQSINVSYAVEVRSGECTLCFECTEVCPDGAALKLVARGVKP